MELKARNIEELISIGLVKYHHSAIHSGYVSRKINSDNYPVKHYKGQFGTGYIQGRMLVA